MKHAHHRQRKEGFSAQGRLHSSRDEEMIKRAMPEVFGDGQVEVHSNYVMFNIPLTAYQKVREWLDRGEARQLEIYTSCRSKDHPDENLKLCIINRKEQDAYAARGYQGN
jgi:hypothetical protein